MAQNPTISTLDPGQIIKRVYDEANDQIRTTIDASVNINGQQTLVINHVEDSIVVVGSEDGTTAGTHHVIRVLPGGTIQTATEVSDTSTITRVAASDTSITLLSLNNLRKGAVFFNESTQICYVKFGTTASSTSYTIPMDPRSTLILEENPIYTGRIDGIWVAANGAMQITELT